MGKNKPYYVTAQSSWGTVCLAESIFAWWCPSIRDEDWRATATEMFHSEILMGCDPLTQELLGVKNGPPPQIKSV